MQALPRAIRADDVVIDQLHTAMRVHGEVHVFPERHRFIVTDERTLDHFISLAVGKDALFLLPALAMTVSLWILNISRQEAPGLSRLRDRKSVV